MGTLWIVSSGPGSLQQLTPAAMKAIAAADVVIGNAFYLDMLEVLLKGKQVIRSSMGKEVDRAKEAARLAADCNVAMITGGDAGVYGMASIVLEVVEHEFPGTDVEVLPGVTAATAAASRLGSPLFRRLCDPESVGSAYTMGADREASASCLSNGGPGRSVQSKEPWPTT